MSSPASSKTPFLRRMVDTVRQARFFSISLVIHMILGITLGGVVLFKAVQDENNFVAVGTAGFLSPTETEIPSEEEAPTGFEEEPSTMEESTLAPAAIMPASALTSVASSASFELANAAPDLSTGASFSAKTPGTLGEPGLKAASGMGSSGRGLSSGSFFGSRPADGLKGLSGIFYDLKQTTGRKPTEMTRDSYETVVADFVKNWNIQVLSGYYKSKEPLIATQIFIPNMAADEGPAAFDMERKVEPKMWLVHYRGKVSPPKSGTYYFVGGGDDVLFVRLNGKDVLEASWKVRPGNAKATKNYDYGFSNIRGGFVRGVPMQLRAGEFYDIEVLIGENPGTFFYSCLLLEEEGATYEKDAKGNPLLPPFRVADIRPPKLKKGQTFPPHAENGGPIWTAK